MGRRRGRDARARRRRDRSGRRVRHRPYAARRRGRRGGDLGIEPAGRLLRAGGVMRRAWLLVAAVALAAGCGGDENGGAAAAGTPVPPPAALANCSSVFYEGPGRPDVLIASDMPLQGTYANDG